MSNKNIFVELDLLATSSDRPDAKRLREILGNIEMYLAKGVSRQKIFEALKKDNYKFTFKSFLVTLSRLRKEKNQQRIKTVANVTSSTLVPVVTKSEESGLNPLQVLASKKKDGEFNPIPSVTFELDN